MTRRRPTMSQDRRAQLDLFESKPEAPDVPPTASDASAGAPASGEDAVQPALGAMESVINPPVEGPGFAPGSVDAAALLTELDRWAQEGWLRRLDAAFARFLHDLEPASEPCTLLVAGVLAHVEGRGDSCVDLHALARDPASSLGWRPLALSAFETLRRGLSSESAAAWLQALRSSKLVDLQECQPQWPDADKVAEDASIASEGAPLLDEARPLVLAGSRLYLRRYWNHESGVAARVAQRVLPAPPALPGDGLEPSRTAVRAQVDRLFGARTEAAVDWQRVACAVALRGGLSIITGGPGTGKTYTAARLLALLFATSPDPTRLRVALAAPTGKAAARLKQSIDTALSDLHARLGGASESDDGSPAELDLRALANQIGPARTLHALLGAKPDSRFFRHDARSPLEVDVLLVDEASMVHLEMMDALLEAMPSHARLVLLGDKDQLASVEAGAVLGDLCRLAETYQPDEELRRYVEETTGEKLPPPEDVVATRGGSNHADDAWRSEGGSNTLRQGPDPRVALARQTVMLRQTRRFGGPIGELASAVRAGDAAEAVDVLNKGDGNGVGWVMAPDASKAIALAVRGYRDYLSLVAEPRSAMMDSAEDTAKVLAILRAFDRFRILCAVREGDFGVDALNAGVARELRAAALLHGAGEWYEGRPVLVTRNDPSIGVFNGDVGIALRSSASSALRVWFANGPEVRAVMASRLLDVQTAFAMTVHKSQGSEFEHTVLVLPPDVGRGASRELVYTGITRARTSFTLVTPRPAAFQEAIARPTVRASGLVERLASR